MEKFKRTNGIFFIGLLFAVSACSTKYPNLTNEGSRVRVASYLPQTRCRMIDEVYASVKDNGDELERMLKAARTMLKNRSSRMGANFVIIDTHDTTTHAKQTILALSGTAYRCYTKVKNEINSHTKEEVNWKELNEWKKKQ